jgi:biopolymer transport protein TolR
MRSDINVTPLIDILLVLLIIFMVITPLAPRGLTAGVPQAATAASPVAELPIVFEVLGNQTIRLNGREFRLDGLKSEIHQLFSSREDKVLFIQADKKLEYREIAQVIDLVHGIDPSIRVGLPTPLSVFSSK